MVFVNVEDTGNWISDHNGQQNPKETQEYHLRKDAGGIHLTLWFEKSQTYHHQYKSSILAWSPVDGALILNIDLNLKM